jgi:nitroreductase
MKQKKDGDMDVLSAIKERRSCRKFSPDAVDDDVIETILEAAVWAPLPCKPPGHT